MLLLFAFRSAAERTLLQTFVARATAADVSIGDVRGGLAAFLRGRFFSLERFHIAGGGAALDVPRIDVRLGGPLEIVMRAPRATVALAAAAPAANPAGAAIAWLTGSHARLRVVDGSLDVAPAAVPAGDALHLKHVNGTLAFDAAANTYDLSGDLGAGERAYPFAAKTERRGGTAFQVWSAAALPVGPLAALYPSSALALSAGELHDVRIADDGTLSVDATLVGVEGAAGAHRLSDVHGPLKVRGDRLGSTGLRGTLDGVPFSLVGEVHDFNDPGEGLRDGTRHLRELDRLFTMVAAQPGLQFVNFETTAPGIAFAQYGERTPVGPRIISLLAVDPSEPSIKLGTAISSDHVISKGERTSQLAQRTGAVAGVNGDYFDIGRSYEPQGLVVRDGAIVRGPTDRAALVIDRSNKVTFAEFRLSGSVETRGRSYPVTQINTWPPGEATVITPDYGAELPPAAAATFVRLEPVDPAAHLFRATAVESAAGGLKVSLGIGFGPQAAGVAPHVGDRFKLDYTLLPNVQDAVAGIGGGPILLKDGGWYEDPHAPAPDERDVRWPVVALGATADGLLLLAAVDGRHPERAVGMTRPEFAELLRSYGVRDAMALDSGGSVTLVARAAGDRVASVRNTPSDDSAERFVSDALLVYSSAPPDEIVRATPSPSPPVPVR